MSKQWFQIIAIWLGVLVLGILATLLLEDEPRYLAYASLAGASIAAVSIEHLISSSSKDTVRQQIYVSAGSFSILGFLTLLSMLG